MEVKRYYLWTREKIIHSLGNSPTSKRIVVTAINKQSAIKKGQQIFGKRYIKPLAYVWKIAGSKLG